MKNNNIKITLIVPFYNVEKYIERCLKSIIKQKFLNFECLLIDDGSLDESYNIAEKITKDDSRFKIIKQINKGLGGARNTGLRNAKGKYITFLDSDDFLHEEFLEIMYNSIDKGNYDVVCCQINRINEFDEISSYKYTKPKAINDKNEILNYLIYNPVAWNKIYRKSAWDNLYFPEKLYFEDMATLYKLHEKISSIKIIDDYLIFYYLRNDSIMNTISKKHIDDCIKVYLDINDRLGYNFFKKGDIIAKITHMIKNQNLKNKENLDKVINYIQYIFPKIYIKDLIELLHDKNFRTFLTTFICKLITIKYYIKLRLLIRK